jgi:hypothetical protein
MHTAGPHRCRGRTCFQKRIAGVHCYRHPVRVAEPLIERAEVVALLFNVSDIAARLASIEQLLEDDDGEEKMDEG